MDRQRRSQVASGVLLIVVGLTFLAGQMGWPVARALDFGRIWPVLFVVLGVGRVLVPADSGTGGRTSGLWLIFVGVVFLLHNYEVLSLAQSWPLFIVLAGASLLLGGGCRRSGAAKGVPRVE